jgi:hypothetical protein
MDKRKRTKRQTMIYKRFHKYLNPLLVGKSRCYNIIACWKSPLVFLCKATFFVISIAEHCLLKHQSVNYFHAQKRRKYHLYPDMLASILCSSSIYSFWLPLPTFSNLTALAICFFCDHNIMNILKLLTSTVNERWKEIDVHFHA